MEPCDVVEAGVVVLLVGVVEAGGGGSERLLVGELPPPRAEEAASKMVTATRTAGLRAAPKPTLVSFSSRVSSRPRPRAGRRTCELGGGRG